MAPSGSVKASELHPALGSPQIHMTLVGGGSAKEVEQAQEEKEEEEEEEAPPPPRTYWYRFAALLDVTGRWPRCGGFPLFYFVFFWSDGFTVYIYIYIYILTIYLISHSKFFVVVHTQ